MDRTEHVLVTLRKQNEALHNALSAQSDINKAIREELEAFGATLITHGDALEETVSRLEAMQAKLDEYDAMIANPHIWQTNDLGPEPFAFAASARSAINERPNLEGLENGPNGVTAIHATPPAAKTEDQIEAEKLEKAKAKAAKALSRS